jgi:protein-tyrosine phosphatase
MVKVCFVCLGNICRSPTAEGVMLHLVEQSGLTGAIDVDSAGTAGYHAGESADRRSVETARRRGIELPSRARQFQAKDFERFDYVLAMDSSNLSGLLRLSKGRYDHKLWLLRDFDAESPKGSGVPDPYYGGQGGFENVLDLCVAACRGLLDEIIRTHGLVRPEETDAG